MSTPSDTDRLRLAYRGSRLTADEDNTFRSLQRLEFRVLAGLPLLVLVGLLIARITLAKLLPLAALAAIVLAALQYVRGSRDKRRLLTVPATIIGALVLVRLSTALLENRIVATAMLAAVALTATVLVGRAQLRFYRDWLLADPRLSKEAWMNLARTPVWPTLWPMLVYVVLMVAVPWRHSVSFAIPCVIVAGLAVAAFLCSHLPGFPWTNVTCPHDSYHRQC